MEDEVIFKFMICFYYVEFSKMIME